MSNLKLRVVSGVLMAAVALLAVYAGGPVFVLFAGIVAALVWYEWLEMTAPSRDDRILLATLALIGAATMVLLVLSGALSIYVLILLWVLGAGALTMAGMPAKSVVGFAYCLGALVSLAQLRGAGGFVPGAAAIVFVFATVWITDIAAYFVGRAVGGPKLAPSISPGKTISGALGGIAGALIAALLVRQVFEPAMGVWAMLVLALLISVVSQAGDLFESSLKRGAGVKDSSQLIPGHGGIMDRVDGLVFGAIALWLVCLVLAGSEAPALALFSPS